jgi:TIR domain
MVGKIFISYRRESEAANALSISQYLEHEFGRKNVFIDVDMRAGAKFPTVLEERLRACKVMLALLGPDWVNAKDDVGQRRLNNPNDWVRLEIGRALARDITVIPVRVNGSDLPKRDTLPTDIQGLLDHQAASVTTASFRNDMAGLVRDIRRIPDGTSLRSAGIWTTVGLLGFALLCLGVYKLGLLDWARLRFAGDSAGQRQDVVFGPEWVLSGLTPNGYAFYSKPDSLKEFPDRVAIATRQIDDPSFPAYQGKMDKEASYEEDTSVYSCNSPYWGTSESTVVGKGGDVRFHYKWGDAQYVDLSKGLQITPGTIAEGMQHIFCDKELRLPLVTKPELQSMDFKSLSSTPKADGEIFYGPNKSSPGKGSNLLITSFNADQSLGALAKSGIVASVLPKYRTTVTSIEVSCEVAKISSFKSEYYDQNNDLRALLESRQTYDVVEGTPFGQLRAILCASAKTKS